MFVNLTSWPPLDAASFAAALVLATTISSLACLAIVKSQSWHGRWTIDGTYGPQKFHRHDAPRVGGFAIFASLCLASTGFSGELRGLLLVLLMSSLPALLAGIHEDLTRNSRIRWRLVATFASGLLACWSTGSLITRVDVWGFDPLLRWLPFAWVFTAFAMAGLSNAMNIIDGFNGLCSGTAMLIQAACAVVAAQHQDTALMQIALLMLAATLGFVLLNFPYGRIFLGDGGSYLLGFLSAWLLISLVARHPDISPWFALLACAYPVTETGFSIWRKSRRRGHHPGMPDRVHLHMLVHTRVARPALSREAKPHWVNSLTGLICLSASLVSCALALACSTLASRVGVLCMSAFVLAYLLVYRRLSRFRW